MWSTSALVLLLVVFESSFICVRSDYDFIDDVNSFYKIFTGKKTWSEANNKCLLDDATLFYPENEKEAQAVLRFWNEKKRNINEIFIGLTDWDDKEIYETVDGRPMPDMYDNLIKAQPTNTERCVVMQKDGSLKVESCKNKYPYICKKSHQWNADCNMPDRDYIYNQELNRCYKFHLAPMNWSDAYNTCSDEVSYLAIINSPKEDEFLINITAQAPKDIVQGDYLRGAVHLGFQNKNGVWETIQGVPLEQSGFAGWGYTQPDGGGKENCGSMFYTGELNDIGCWQRMFFICEHEIELR